MYYAVVEYAVKTSKNISDEMMAIFIVITIIVSIVLLILGFRLIRAGVIEDKFWKIFFGVCLTGFLWGALYYFFKRDQLKREAEKIKTKDKKTNELKKLKDDIELLKKK